MKRATLLMLAALLAALLVAPLGGCIEGKSELADESPGVEQSTDGPTADRGKPDAPILDLGPGDHTLKDLSPHDGPGIDQPPKTDVTVPADGPPPSPDACPTFRICGGSCCSATEFCVVGASPSCATVPASSTVLYATAMPYSGNLGGRSGADAKCTASKPAGLPCAQPRAFLSVGTPTGGAICGVDTDEIQDMPVKYGFAATKPLYFYHKTTGHLRQLATTWPDALDGSIDVTAAMGTGASFGSWNAFWTGSKNNGAVDQVCTGDPTYHWNYSCLGWGTSATSSATHAFGGVGNASSTTIWISSSSNYLQCSNTFLMLCACKL